MKSARVTLQLVGPLRRSTFPQRNADQLEESINDLLHWVWSTRLQIRRLSTSVRVEFKALNWRQGVRRRRKFSNTSYDEHILLVAAANLDRAIGEAPKSIRSQVGLPKSSRRALWLLRNIYEHWDQLRKAYRAGSGNLPAAAAKLKEEFPDADPWSITIEPASGEIVLANVVPLTPLVGELRGLELRLLKLERKRRRLVARAPSSPRQSPAGKTTAQGSSQ